MISAFADLNWIAIMAATAAYYLLGAAWFTPLFGKAWDASIGFQRTKGQSFGADYYAVPFVSCVLVTVATGVLVEALDLTRLSDALVLGAVVGVGYVASISVNNALTPHTPRPYVLGAVTGGYHLTGVVIVSLILVAFN